MYLCICYDFSFRKNTIKKNTSTSTRKEVAVVAAVVAGKATTKAGDIAREATTKAGNITKVAALLAESVILITAAYNICMQHTHICT